ncbi:MAG: phosphomannomutase/phosphoglucomutase [Aggregatilineales bacterium]
MQFHSVIFRKYDIRGTVIGDDPQITPELARAVGMGYGTYMQRTFQTERVYVGCDNRPTSPMLKAALIEGLLSTGLDVTDLGEVMTPTVYYASAQHGARAGGVQITGSHLSLQFNGIKMAYDRFALYGEQIQAIRALIEADDFERGSGTLTRDDSLVKRHMQTIASKVQMGPRKLKIVLDAGNSLSGLFMQPVYEQLGIEVICLYCEPDGTFPNHLPNPEDPETTKDLERAVVENGADMGIGFDGDADRCGIIDEHGHHIAADRLLALLARDLLSRHKGAKIVFDVKASQALEDEIRAHGGVPIMWKTGHSLMKAKMAEEGAPLGGEVSGHLFIGEDYYGFDDAPLVSLKVLEIFSKETRTVSQVFDSIPKLVATPEVIVSAPDDRKFQIIEALQSEFAAEHPVITLDGARVAFEHGWGLVRASNTQPAITMRFEARTKADLVTIMQDFDRRLARYPEVARDKLQELIAAFSA